MIQFYSDLHNHNTPIENVVISDVLLGDSSELRYDRSKHPNLTQLPY